MIADRSPQNSQTFLKIKIKLNKIEFVAIIDTGSSVSFIHPNALNKIKAKTKIKKASNIKLLDQSTFKLEKFVRLETTVDEDVYLHDFFIYDKLSKEVLLGLDFCRKANLIITFDQETEHIHNLDTNAGEDDIVFKVTTREEIEIEPKTLSYLPCYMSINNDSIMEKYIFGPIYFHPNKILTKTLGVIIDNSIQYIERDNYFYCVVWNPSEKTIKISDNLEIGTATPLGDDVQIADNTESACFAECPDADNCTDKDFQIGPINMEQRLEVLNLLEKNRDIFGDSVSQLGKATEVEHEINLSTDTPIKLRSYRHSPKEKQIIREQVKEMLEAGVIEESYSPYSFPVVLVKKKNGKYRFCIDYRKLNEITIKDRHPLPVINDTIHTLSQSKYFSVMDLLSGYWNIELRESDKPKTAFITPEGLYQFRVLPFGLCNSPATFQRYIQKVLADLINVCCVVYLDDVLVSSNSFKEHLIHLELVLNRIREYNLKIQIEKCNFLCEEVKYLGHIVSTTGIRPDPDKITAVKNFPIPKTVKQTQSFLGLANYYRNFVERFAQISEPLTNLTRKNTKFIWTEECQKCFELLKQKLITAPILAQYREDCENEVFTDSSDFGMGSILGQIQDSKHVVISYDSKMFNKAQLNYSVSEKELLAILYALRKYRHYIHGTKFTVYCDHNALQYIVNLKNPTGRLMRWALALSEFMPFNIVYKPGKFHQNADALSRFPFEKPDYTDEEFPVFLTTTVDMAEEQRNDEWCKKIIDGIQKDSTNKDYRKFRMDNNKLYRITYGEDNSERSLLCVPKLLRRQVLQDLHDNETGGGHLGFLKTYVKARTRFFWPNIEKSIRKYVRNCVSCQLNKPDNRLEKGLMQPIASHEPFEIVGLDIFGPITRSRKGNKYIILLVDLFSKWLETKAVKNIRSITISKWFTDEVLTRHGAINRVITDNARNFCSKFMEDVFKLTASHHVKSTPYSPTTNGNVEKMCDVVKTMLKHYVNPKMTNWDEFLPKLTFSYNVSQHKSTKMSPFTLLYGRDPKIPIDVSFDLPRNFRFGESYREFLQESRKFAEANKWKAQRDAKFYYDKTRRDVEFLLVIKYHLKPRDAKWG